MANKEQGFDASRTRVGPGIEIGDIVKVRRSGGAIEEGWTVIELTEGGATATCQKWDGNRPLQKDVPVAELAKLNAEPETAKTVEMRAVGAAPEVSKTDQEIMEEDAVQYLKRCFSGALDMDWVQKALIGLGEKISNFNRRFYRQSNMSQKAMYGANLASEKFTIGDTAYQITLIKMNESLDFRTEPADLWRDFWAEHPEFYK